MGKRGPAKKPRQILEAKGARVRKDRYPDNAMKIEAGGKTAELTTPISAPEYMTEGAKEIWEVAAKFLNDNEMSHKVFNGSLEVYCNSLDLYRKSVAYMDTPGIGYVLEQDTRDGSIWKPRPEVKIVNDAANQIKSVATQFGFTPSSVGQIRVEKGSGEVGNAWDKIKAG